VRWRTLQVADNRLSIHVNVQTSTADVPQFIEVSCLDADVLPLMSRDTAIDFEKGE
jgi:hypothetical protein